MNFRRKYKYENKIGQTRDSFCETRVCEMYVAR